MTTHTQLRFSDEARAKAPTGAGVWAHASRAAPGPFSGMEL
ncbi:MAG: hypothetical protein PVH21_09570 [Myxococcales bacterium]